MAAFCDIKLEACNLAATKPKHVFGKIKRQKCSLLTKPRIWLLSDRNRLKRCSECPLAKNWKRNPFTGAITLEKAQFDGNQSKNMFLVQ